MQWPVVLQGGGLEWGVTAGAFATGLTGGQMPVLAVIQAR